tara:strand:+ start:151 stop:459 length:309 start_codon:yes stop_codon:yes gene_type:complete
MAKKPTQKDKILKHLKENNKITSMEAFRLYNITRVGAVIDTLRKEGYEIDTQRPDKGSYGIYVLLGTKNKPNKENNSLIEIQQTDLGFDSGSSYKNYCDTDD